MAGFLAGKAFPARKPVRARIVIAATVTTCDERNAQMDRLDYERAIWSSGLPSLARLCLFIIAQSVTSGPRFLQHKFSLSTSNIADRAGLTRDSVIKYLRIAQDKGWIEQRNGGCGQADRNQYLLTVPGTHSDDVAGAAPAITYPQVPASPALNDSFSAGSAGTSFPQVPASPALNDSFSAGSAGTCGKPSDRSDQRKQAPMRGRARDRARASDFDLKDDDLIKTAREEVEWVTGRRVGPVWGARLCQLLLEGRDVKNAAGYLRIAIRNEPDPRTRFLSLYDDQDLR